MVLDLLPPPRFVLLWRGGVVAVTVDDHLLFTPLLHRTSDRAACDRTAIRIGWAAPIIVVVGWLSQILVRWYRDHVAWIGNAAERRRRAAAVSVVTGRIRHLHAGRNNRGFVRCDVATLPVRRCM
jgi:hypothetical protein